MDNPLEKLEQIFEGAVEKLLHRADVKARRIAVKLQLRELSELDAENAATDYQPGIDGLSK